VAHPALSGLKEADLRAFAEAGLCGVEVDHPGQTPDVRKTLRGWARTLRLCATAGSDYHASENGGMRLGTEGMEPTEFAGYEALSHARAAGP
jgi:predicted metal-dependent phosphoesterase TrpH